MRDTDMAYNIRTMKKSKRPHRRQKEKTKRWDEKIDLLVNYPKTKRNVAARGATKTDEDRAIARKFGKDFLTAIENMVTEGFLIIPGSGNP